MSGHFRTAFMAVLMVAFFLSSTNEAEAKWANAGSLTCATSGCHPKTGVSVQVAPTIEVAYSINGGPSTSYAGGPIPVNVGDTIEIDWKFLNLGFVNSLSGGVHLPTGWTPSAGSTLSSAVSSRNGVWDQTAGAAWSTIRGTGNTNSPDGYMVDFGGSSWGTAAANLADDGAGTDLDSTAETMGLDVSVMIPAGTGLKYIEVFGSGKGQKPGKTQALKLSIAQVLTLDVSASGGDTTKPVVTAGFAATSPVITNVSIPITAFAATDDTAVTGYMISESATLPLSTDGAWTGTAPLTFTATAGDGTKTLYPWAKDAAGNVSLAYATPASVVVDGTGPTDGILSVTPGNAQNDLSWTVATDTGVGLRTGTIYDVRFLTGGTAPTCASGTSIYTGDNLTYLHPTLANGTQYSYRVCAYDTLNNPSTGATGTGTPSAGNANPDTPTNLAQYLIGGVTPIALGGYTAEASVVFEADIADSSDVGDTVKLQIDTDSNGTFDCESTLGTNPSTNVQVSCALADGSYDWQARTVDNIGAVSAWVPFNGATPDFTKDVSAPVDGTLTATPGDTQVVLNWTAASDTHSGLTSPAYAVAKLAGGTPPADCSTPLATTDLLTYTDNAVANGSTYSYRICATNSAGLQSAGTIDSATPSAGCTYTDPTVTILTASKDITTDGGFTDYTVQVTNNDTAICANANYTLSVSDSNSTNFYSSVLSQTSLTNVVPGASVQTTFRVSALANQPNTSADNSDVTTAADANHLAVTSTVVTTTINVSGGGCVANGNYPNANGDQLISSRR